jgi:hypothetical protein
MSYTIGLDLGQAHDPSALVILEHQGGRSDAVDIRRWPLGTPYTQIVVDVAAIRTLPALVDAHLVVDGTGVGRGVVDMFRAGSTRRLVPVLITSGAHAHMDEYGYWLCPKKELVAAVQVGLQSRTLKIAASLDHAKTLLNELTQFQAKITDAAHVQTGAWREGQHDDLVLALALALWYVPRQNSAVGAFNVTGGQNDADKRHLSRERIRYRE